MIIHRFYREYSLEMVKVTKRKTVDTYFKIQIIYWLKSVLVNILTYSYGTF